MTSFSARAVPWHAVVRFHREVTRRAGAGSFALPVADSAPEHWSSLAGFEPGQLAGPWEVDFQVLESPHLQREIRTGLGEAFIGGPCWFRWSPESDEPRCLEWIPLIYREVTLEHRDDRLSIVPARDGWEICPPVFHFLEQRGIQTLAPLDELLPDLLSRAESKAAEDGLGLTRMLAEAFRLVAPELGKALLRAHEDFPADRVERVPSPWVLFTPSVGRSTTTQRVLDEYTQLARRLAEAPQAIGGLGLLEGAAAPAARAVPDVLPLVPLDDSQRSAVASALAGRAVTVIDGPQGCRTSEILMSILLNAWANATSVLFAGSDDRAVEDLLGRLRSLESAFEIAVLADENRFQEIDKALGRAIDLIATRRGESHYGGSLSARKHGQLTKRQQRLREMLERRVPQRLGEAIEAALESHRAQRRALEALEARREELIEALSGLGVEADPGSFRENVLEPLRKWRSGIDATRRLVKEDAQREATLQKELSTARSDRDSALAECQIETGTEQELSWLLAEPGFRSFEQALAALFEKLREPIEDVLSDTTWDKAYDEWPSSEAAADWERKAREMASLIRPAGIALKEKAEEVRAAREALDSAQRTVQDATKSSSLDVRREDLDEWAECYAELCALPRTKLRFLSKSRSTELVRQLEKVERRLRISFPVHLWTSIGTLDETGRERLSVVIERAREWTRAREDWERLGPVREEIEEETDALRRKLDALGLRSLSTEMTPGACAAIASKLNDKASVAGSAAAAWSKREARERLPAEVVELSKRIRAAGAGTPFKERWIEGAGTALVAALDSVASNPGVATLSAVRSEVLGAAATDPVLKSWQRAYESEEQCVAIAEELERIPSRAARLSHWKSRHPGSLPTAIDVSGAFDDDAHPVWSFLEDCEEWNRRWAAYRDEDAPALERTANAEGASAVRRIGEAAQTLPGGKERAWLESLASGSTAGHSWPEDKLKELAALWRPERLQAKIEEIGAQLERSTFESARERWLDRIAYDAEVSRSLGALRDHYGSNPGRFDESACAHFEQALKAQPVWMTSSASVRPIPMQAGIFDLLVVDAASRRTLTEMLPLVFRAKRLIVIGDAAQSTPPEGPGADAERELAARFLIEEWAGTLGHADNSIYKTAVRALPRRRADVISLVTAEGEAGPGARLDERAN